MKLHYLLLIISNTLLLNCYSQQDPLFSSEGFTPLRTNPASFGSWNKFSVNAIGRLQWVGLEGAPNSLVINSEFSGKIGDNANSRWNNFAVGIDLLIEEIGFQQNQQLKIPIVYPIKLGDTQLAFGVAAGFNRVQFTPNWTPADTINDPLIPGNVAQTVFDMDGGIMWYGDRFYAGLSMTHLTSPVMADINYKITRHYYVHGAYRFELGEYTLMPTVRARFDGSSFAAENMNYFMFKKEIVSLGVGYRLNSAVLAAVAVQWKGMRLAYNFDYDLSSLSNYNRNSHEVRLSYILKK